MEESAQAVIASLSSGVFTEDTLLLAADLIAKLRNADAGASGRIEGEGKEATAQQGEDVQLAVVEAIERETDLRRRAGLLWALGKSGDARYKSLYLSHLRQFAEHVLAGNAGIFQTLIALDNADEDVFESDAQGSISQGVTDVEKNLRQALTFLRRHGAMPPY